MPDIYQCRLCDHTYYDIITENIKDWEYGIEGNYQFVECKSCSSIQIHPFPSIDELEKAYEIDYHGYQDEVSKGAIFNVLYFFKEWLFQRKFKPYINPNSRILDVGCGAGGFLSSLSALGINKLEGLDFNDKALQLLERKGIKGHKQLFINFDAPPGSYDIISMNNYLEHTLNPREELLKSRKLLKPNGLLLGEVPGFDSYERRIFKNYWGGNHVPRHTFQFNQKFLKDLLKEAGYRNIKIVHELNTGHWALSVQNYLQRNACDLRNNTSIKHGRARYYFPLLLAFIPINVFCVLVRKAGVIKFFAKA